MYVFVMHHAHKPDLYLPSSCLPFLPSFPHLSSPSSSSSISLLYTLLFSPFSLTCSSPSPLSSVLPPPTSPLLSVSFPSLPPSSPLTGVRHDGVMCEGCRCSPLAVAGVRWKYVDCADINLCSTCYHGDR